MQYKALISDIDGTILPNSEHGTISDRVREAIAQADKLIHVGVATARPLFSAKRIIQQLTLSGPSIVGSGSQIIDSETFTVLHEELLTIPDTLTVIQQLKELGCSFWVNDGNREFLVTKNYSPVKPFNLLTEPLSPEIANILIATLTNIPSVAAYKVPAWDHDKVHVMATHIKATKQHGIYHVAKILGITTDEIIGIGDGHNDFPLLMACGLRVAIGNAVPELKVIADYVAPTVYDDGVADVIEKYILKS